MTESNYTMIPDILIDEFGLITASVYGIVWRYGRMDSGTCTVSQSKIASRCGISRSCAIVHLNLLVKEEYLTQKTIDGIGVVYKTTPKITYSSGEQDVSTKRIPTYSPGEHKESLLRDTLRHKDDWEIQLIAERVTGLMMCQADIQILQGWEKLKVTEDDMRAALQWRLDHGKKPVKTIGDLDGGVITCRNKRVQAKSAKPGKTVIEPVVRWSTE